MRKVLVLGTVLAAAGASAGVVAGPAQATATVTVRDPAGGSPGASPASRTATASPPVTPESTPRPPQSTPDVPPGTAPGSDGGGDGGTEGGTPGGASTATDSSATAVATASASAVMVTPPLPARETHPYGQKSRNKVDVYFRRTGDEKAKRPAVLILHGGSWLKGDKKAWADTAIELTNRGYVAFAANYRFTDQAEWPAQRNDVVSAVRFIKRHADRFGVDPDNVVVLGSSAGGHLATMLGVFGTGSERVRGVVALSPVASPFLAFTDGGKPDADEQRADLRKAVVQLVGCTPVQGDATCWPKIEDAAAVTHASAGDAPMLIIHSEGDFVPATHAMGLRDALARFGVPVTVKIVPGAQHGGAIVTDPQQFDAVVNWIDSLVKSPRQPVTTP